MQALEARHLHHEVAELAEHVAHVLLHLARQQQRHLRATRVRAEQRRGGDHAQL
jgi:hypothetical protein